MTVCNHIHYMIVSLVTDSREHRQRAFCNLFPEVIVIIAEQVGLGSSAAQNQYEVKIPGAADKVYAGADRVRTSVSLHQGLEQREIIPETVLVASQMLYEVSVSGGISGRYHSYPRREEGKPDRFLEIDKTGFRKTPDGLLLLQLPLAYGICCIYILYDQRQAVTGGILYGNPYYHRDSRDKLLSRKAAEQSYDTGIRLPDDSPGSCQFISCR